MGHAIDPERIIIAHIPLDPAGPGGRFYQSEFKPLFLRQPARPLQTAHDRGRAPEEFNGICQVAARIRQALEQVVTLAGRKIEDRAARGEESPAKAAAAEDSGHIEKISPDAATEGRGGKIADIACDGPQIAV